MRAVVGLETETVSLIYYILFQLKEIIKKASPESAA